MEGISMTPSARSVSMWPPFEGDGPPFRGRCAAGGAPARRGAARIVRISRRWQENGFGMSHLAQRGGAARAVTRVGRSGAEALGGDLGGGEVEGEVAVGAGAA